MTFSGNDDSTINIVLGLLLLLLLSVIKKPHVRRTLLHNKNITNETHK